MCRQLAGRPLVMGIAAGFAAGWLLACPGPAPAAEPRVVHDAAGNVSVRTEGAPLGEVLARLGALAGISITSLSPDLLAQPVAAAAGPGPIEQVVRDLVRPHGVAVLYGAGGRATVIVVVPGGREAAGPRAADGGDAPSAPPPTLADLGPSADPAAREASVLALGRDLDDASAVTLLEAAARGESGLGPDDPARLLARSLLSTLPDRADDEGEETGESEGDGEDDGPA